MTNVLDGVAEFIARVASVLGLLAGLVMIGSLLIGIFYRYALQSALPWSGELAVIAFVWTIFLLGSSLVRSDGHVRVPLLIDRLPFILRELAERVVLSLVMVTGLFMAWFGVEFTAFTAGQTFSATGYPMWWRNTAVPVGGALIAFHALVLIFSGKRIAKRGDAVVRL